MEKLESYYSVVVITIIQLISVTIHEQIDWYRDKEKERISTSSVDLSAPMMALN